MTKHLSSPALAALLQLDSQIRLIEESADICAVLRCDTTLMKLQMKESMTKSISARTHEEWAEEVYARILARAGDQMFFNMN